MTTAAPLGYDPPIRSVPRPPSDRGLYRPLATVPATGSLDAWVISARPVGFSMHYDANIGKCIPCRKPAPCMCTSTPMRAKWVAYIEVALKPRLQRAILILPQGAVDHCPAMTTDELLTLRGLKLRAYRLRPGHRSPVRAEITAPESWERVPVLGEPCDLIACLNAAWNRLTEGWIDLTQ